MPGIAQRISNNTSGDNNDSNSSYLNPLVGNGKLPFHSFNGSSVSSNGFWSQHRGDVSYNQLQQFWFDLTPQARKNLLRIDKQILFEHSRKNMYCSRCHGLLVEGFMQIVMYGKSLQQDAAVSPYSVKATDYQNDDTDLCMANGCQGDVRDPSVHPWGGLTTARNGTLTLLDCYLYSNSLKGLQNVFDSARARERERELLYPDACGGGGRGWISQGVAGYGRLHGTRDTCALHTARLSVETLVDFWSALGEETRQSLLRLKEEDFIERLMQRFDNKRFCRDCRRNVLRELKELKELKRMRKETRCTSWFCVADTAFQYEVSRDSVQADWHQTFSDAFGTYHHFEWAIGTGEGKSDILEFENVGLSGKVQVNGLDLSGVNACYITLRACKIDGRCNELCVKAHALRGQQCVHCRLVVGDGFVTILRGESITRFFEHAEEAEEEEDDDSMDKDGNDLDGECSRPQKHAKSPELAREFLLDAATVIFKEQVEKAFREGTARQNAHSMFVCLALKLLEERIHIACKEIITLEKQMKLLEEEEKEKREEEERKERRRTKEREKKLRRKERLREKENRDKKPAKSNLDDPVVTDVVNEESITPSVDEVVNNECSRDSGDDDERGEPTPTSPLSPGNIQDDQLSTGYTYSTNTDSNNPSEDIQDGEFANNRDWNTSFPYDHHLKYSRRKLVFRKDSQRDFNLKWSDRRKGPSENGFESTRSINGFNKQLRTNAASSNLRYGGSKSSEKFQCTNNRMGGDRYDSHSCSCNHHHHQHPEYRSRSEPHITKPYNRGKAYNTQVDCPREINGRPKSKIFAGNTPTTKKVWEPLDSQKKCTQSMKIEASESDQLPECCSTSSDEVTDISVVQTNQDFTRSISENSKHIENEFHTVSKPQGSSMSTSSNSDNCSSCLSEGDNSNPQNTESTSSSDSEESSQISDGKDTVENHNTPRGQNGKTQELASAGTNTLDGSLKEVAPYCVQSVLPQMHHHNRNINYPIFQAPAMGYYHQNPVSWQPGPTNGLMSFPHSNHYLFPNSFGYGLNGNAPFVQYGALQHLAPPLLNHAPHVPVFQPVSHVNGVSTNVTGLKEADSVIPKVPLTEGSGTVAVVDDGHNRTDMGNNGFSLFHFGGPVALSTGFNGDHRMSLNEGIAEDKEKSSANCPGADHPCGKKESIEEYNLFAATNGIKFSIF
ncbi:hypothetical protein PHJA_002579100 [Phtheirospermum japonicum]|uniref:Stress response protein NST1 n=1 Tax=Phtheirospermum japonicum TaxID=374723 RepID=A0A830DDD4_9LAMI|nr:hypothetical protein PHJA_002579100 [Phtheirospermum japonicum]